MARPIMVIHECQGDAADMFYCYGIGGTSDPGGHDGLDWYTREDSTVVSPDGEMETVSCIIYCPFCGMKLPETIRDAVGSSYRFEEVRDEGESPDVIICTPKGWHPLEEAGVIPPGSQTGKCDRCGQDIWLSWYELDLLDEYPDLPTRCIDCLKKQLEDEQRIKGGN